MRVDIEIEEFLNTNLKENNTKLRDIDLILYFYGFKGDIYPTLEDAGLKYGLGTSKNRRELPRQIINDKFKNIKNVSTIPSILECEKLIECTEFSSIQETYDLFRSKDLIPEEGSIKGVLNLLHSLDKCKEHEIYNSDLKLATRSTYGKSLNLFLVKKDILGIIKNRLKTVLTFPGRVGIAKVSNLRNEIGVTFSHFDELIKLLKSRNETWYFSDEGEDYYLIENNNNFLINSLKKIKNIADFVELDELATALENSFKTRTAPADNEYPDKSIIKQYLMNSVHTSLFDKGVTLKVESIKLNPIDKDIISYFEKHKISEYPQVSEFLATKDYGKPHIQKAVMSSPIVFVDKTNIRSHKYRLVGSSTPKNATEDLYEKYRRRLAEVGSSGTDQDQEIQARREHHILTEWLFEGKEQENCAICGELFSVKSLNTAHKKRRADCSTNERLDPYIVMPLCNYGCDYIYEKGFIWIDDGKTKVNPTANLLTARENDYILSLENKPVNERWLKGNKTYFRKP